MCLCICGWHFMAFQLNKAEKYKGRSFLWKDDTQVHMLKTMILRIRNILIFPFPAARAH